MNTFIRLLYAVLVAAAVVTFVGVGLYTFYPGPQAPTFSQPITDKQVSEPASQIDYQKAYDKYNADMKVYQRNVSIILVSFAAPIVALGLWLRQKSDIIGEGLALGGIGTSIYAVGMAVSSDDRIMRFIAVTLFLASAIVVVYFKFNAAQPAKKPTRKHT